MTALFFEQALRPDGWHRNVRIVLAGNRIVDVISDTVPRPLDERHGIGIPGMPNLHSHAFQRGMAGLAEVCGPVADNFWTWREQMYRFALAMSPDDVEAVAAQSYVEMLEAGFTRVGEFHYLHHDCDGQPYGDIAELGARIAAASQATGIALTLLPVFYAHSNFGGAAPHTGQRRFVSTVDQYQRLFEASAGLVTRLDGGIIGVAPHSLRAVTPHQLRELAVMATDRPVHIHVAEQTKEVDDCIAWSGQRPVEWLLNHANPDQRWCFIHATHMTTDETTRMANSGVTAGLCPITEANLGDGIFAGSAFSAAGGNFGIGTDSNVLIGVADELRQLEYAQRLGNRARNVLGGKCGRSTGRAVFDAALHGGALALGQISVEGPLVGLAVGASADLVSLDPHHLSLVGRSGDANLDAWIFATRDAVINDVWCRGVKVVTAGRHTKHDDIGQRYAKTIRKLLS
jgi:formimidoylglutamate deiminase